MGQAIAERIKDKYAVSVYDKDSNKISGLTSITASKSAGELVRQSEVVIIAVKPQNFDSLLNEIKSSAQGKLIITIAAGITTSYIEKHLGSNTHVIRVMPNMPAQIGKGVSGICKGRFAEEKDFDLAWQLFGFVGFAATLDDERMMDTITAISGSGPAFYCYYIKDAANVASKKDEFVNELTQVAISLNFDPMLAKHISEKTVEGTVCLLMENRWTCEELIKRVASKGGTTEAGLEILYKGGSLVEAVRAAVERARELSRG